MKPILYILTLIFICSCNVKLVKVNVIIPAKVDLSNYKNIIIGEFTDSKGERDFELESTLREMFLEFSNYNLYNYEYIRNTDINDSTLNPLLVLDAKIIHKDIYSKGDFTVDSDNTNISFVRQMRYYFDIVYEVSFRLTDYKSGRIIYEKTFKEIDEDNIYHTGNKDLNINKSKYFTVMKNKLADKLFREIFPTQKPIEMKFYNINSNFKKGISYAENGKLEKALYYFENLITKISEPKELSFAYYNLGVCYLYTYNFEDAEYYFKEADKINRITKYDYMIDLTKRMKYAYENEYNK